jgi:hypothetical protein
MVAVEISRGADWIDCPDDQTLARGSLAAGAAGVPEEPDAGLETGESEEPDAGLETGESSFLVAK